MLYFLILSTVIYIKYITYKYSEFQTHTPVRIKFIKQSAGFLFISFWFWPHGIQSEYHFPKFFKLVIFPTSFSVVNGLFSWQRFLAGLEANMKGSTERMRLNKLERNYTPIFPS